MKKKEKKKILNICITTACAVASTAIILFALVHENSKAKKPAENEPAVVQEISKAETETALTEDLPEENALSKEDVFTFLQGPKSYKGGYYWSGEWAEFLYKGNSFGGFGCGLCCIANIYDSLTPYYGSPLDAFDFAMKNSDYSPTGKVGAISWEDLKKSLEACGFKCELGKKPATMDDFRKEMKNSLSAIVLVSSSESKVLWPDTSGHYVNIWLYNDKTDQVFLADPGSPERNRMTIPAAYPYESMKTISDYQVLYVRSYDETKDKWKNKTMTGVWNSPRYIERMLSER